METKKRQHILIVDDEESIRTVLAKFLGSKGFDTTTAESVQAAQQVLSTKSFDLVVLDVQFPDGDGLDFLEEIHQQLPELPVIILTGLGFREDLLQRAKALGAKGFVSKTLPVHQMFMEVRHALKIR
ncbi:MAG: response regulator [Verrucomicrobiota bacterium]